MHVYVPSLQAVYGVGRGQLVPQFAGQEKKIEIHLSSGQVSLLFSLSNF